MEWGIDVSRWQGNFNFAKAKEEGITFAILKAGGGDAGLYKDSKFERNYAECVRLGIPVGAYFFGQAMDIPTAQKEADYFLNLIAGKKFDIGVWYDVEGKMLNAGGLVSIVNGFILRLKSNGYECGVYSSESVFKGKLKDISAQKWVARWTKTKPSIDFKIWQFGGETNLIRSKKVAGVTCDQNYLQGEIEKPVVPEKETKEEYDMPTIKKGCKGKSVKIWQIILGITADGVFGPITEQKTKEWQNQHLDVDGKKLIADGIVGPKTWRAGIDTL